MRGVENLSHATETLSSMTALPAAAAAVTNGGLRGTRLAVGRGMTSNDEWVFLAPRTSAVGLRVPLSLVELKAVIAALSGGARGHWSGCRKPPTGLFFSRRAGPHRLSLGSHLHSNSGESSRPLGYVALPGSSATSPANQNTRLTISWFLQIRRPDTT